MIVIVEVCHSSDHATRKLPSSFRAHLPTAYERTVRITVIQTCDAHAQLLDERISSRGASKASLYAWVKNLQD
jgi:hypothetical protein